MTVKSTTLIALLCLLPVAVLAIPPPPPGYNANDGPVTWDECYDVSPNPTYTSCSALTPAPVNDFLSALPYNDPAYQVCVYNRCNCTNNTAFSPGFTPAGLYCSGTAFNENGFTTCDQMNDCFEVFWRCVIDTLMDRYYTLGYAALTAAEQAASTDILQHGSTPGQEFEDTESYRSCRSVQCSAAASRKNCGLVTCVPNYTQCYEYIKPPPLPYHHQLCTEGCRAVLVLMALTIVVFTFAFLCCGCCPAPVRVVAPLITDNQESEDEKEKEKKSVGSEKSSKKSSNFTHASE